MKTQDSAGTRTGGCAALFSVLAVSASGIAVQAGVCPLHCHG